MTRIAGTAALLAGLAALSACSEAPLTEPEPTLDRAAVADAGLATLVMEAPPVRHVVVFNGKAPKDFEATVAELGGTIELNHPIGIAVVSGLDPASAAALQGRVGARFVEENAEMELVEPAATELALELAPASPTDPTGASAYAQQWNMRQIHADAAWGAGRLGSEDVTVAILDTGIDDQIPDMVGRVDLSRSASFEPLDDLYAAYYHPGRHPSIDLHYHGTNVATQVASNAAIYAGVTSRTTLMSVKVCSFLGGCHGVIEGLLFAIDNGADVINMSLGGWFSKRAYPGNVAAYNAIMNYASQQGVTIVVSAGNDSNDLDRHHNIGVERDADGNIIRRAHVPSIFATYCDARHVICVSATRDNDLIAGYTNYGRSAIDVAAPGGYAGEWVRSICPPTTLRYNCVHPLPGWYYTIGVAGTSQAAPHVSGLAALAVEDVGREPAKVAAYIRNSADAIGGGNTAHYGKGRINVARAVGVN